MVNFTRKIIIPIQSLPSFDPELLAIFRYNDTALLELFLNLYIADMDICSIVESFTTELEDTEWVTHQVLYSISDLVEAITKLYVECSYHFEKWFKSVDELKNGFDITLIDVMVVQPAFYVLTVHYTDISNYVPPSVIDYVGG